MLLSAVSLTTTANAVTVDLNDIAGHTLLFVDGGAAHQTRLTVDGGAETYTFDNPTSQLVINSLAGGDTITIGALDGAFGAAIHVFGNGGDDALVVDAMTGSGGILFDGGAGSNRLGGPAQANTWSITGVNAGMLDSLLTFLNVSSLTGGGVSESISFASGASLSGTIDGQGGDLTLTSGDTLTIPAGAIVSSRKISFGADPETGLSTGDSGSLTLISPHISIGAGAKLLANANNAKLPGDVTLQATDEASLNWALGMIGFKSRSTSTSINVGSGAVIKGDNVTITSTAKTDKTADLEVDLAHDTRQAVLADVNNNGLADLILGNNGASSQLYINSGHALCGRSPEYRRRDRPDQLPGPGRRDRRRARGPRRGLSL